MIQVCSNYRHLIYKCNYEQQTRNNKLNHTLPCLLGSEQLLTLIGLVLSAHSLQLLQRLFVGCLELEELAGMLPALLLTRLHFSNQLLALLLPVSQLLLQDPLLFVQCLATATGLQDNMEAISNAVP